MTDSHSNWHQEYRQVTSAPCSRLRWQCLCIHWSTAVFTWIEARNLRTPVIFHGKARNRGGANWLIPCEGGSIHTPSIFQSNDQYCPENL